MGSVLYDRTDNEDWERLSEGPTETPSESMPTNSCFSPLLDDVCGLFSCV